MTHPDRDCGEPPAGGGPGRPGERDVVLYGRHGCCLCDEARAVLLGVRAKHPFRFAERDIEQDEALLGAYLERIPVVTIDGVEAFELYVDPAELKHRLS